MAEKKMARGGAKQGGGKPCPKCKTPMVATRVIKTADRPGGMYWICPKEDHREKV